MWLLMVVWVALMGAAQRKADYRKMSRFVRQAEADHQQRSLTRGGSDAKRMLTAFVCISPEEVDDLFKKHNCQKRAQWGDICIASIPLAELGALAKEPAVTRIEANQSTSLCVDTTAAVVQALPVYESSPSHQAYTGEGVVVGVVDIGFDLTHPNFLDNTTGQSRIRAFWDQLSRDTIGSALPIGRDYVGAEAISATHTAISNHTRLLTFLIPRSSFLLPRSSFHDLSSAYDIHTLGQSLRLSVFSHLHAGECIDTRCLRFRLVMKNTTARCMKRK